MEGCRRETAHRSRGARLLPPSLLSALEKLGSEIRPLGWGVFFNSLPGMLEPRSRFGDKLRLTWYNLSGLSPNWDYSSKRVTLAPARTAD